MEFTRIRVVLTGIDWIFIISAAIVAFTVKKMSDFSQIYIAAFVLQGVVNWFFYVMMLKKVCKWNVEMK